MRTVIAVMFLMVLPLLVVAQLAVSPETEMQVVFSGELATVVVLVGNNGREAVKGVVSTRIIQLASATGIPLGERQPWKELEVLAGQTVREKLDMTLPALAEPTRYRIEIANAQGDRLGPVLVLACPRNSLEVLGRWSGGRPIGVLDADGKLEAMLKKNGVPTSDLTGDVATADFRGPLALLRGAEVSAVDKERLRGLADLLAKRGVAVLWLRAATAGIERETRTIGTRGTVCELALRDLDRLEGSAAAQLRILESARFLIFHSDESPAKSDP